MQKILGNLILALVLLVVSTAVLFTVNRATAPTERVLPPKGATETDYAAVTASISEATIEQELRTFSTFGPRMIGLPGHAKAEAHIKASLQASGYQVLEQPYEVTVPYTENVSLTDASGAAIAGIQLYPMAPNGFRTCSTPKDGIRGTIYAGQRGLAREFSGIDLAGNIVLLPIGAAWSTVAGMGAKAILFYDPQTNATLSRWQQSIPASVNIPRFFVTGDVSKLNGAKVVLKAHIGFEQRIVRNIIGVLPSVNDSREAVVLGTYFDTYSWVPDLSVGAEQAVSPAVTLLTARHLAQQEKKTPGSLRRPVMVFFNAAHCQAQRGMREFTRTIGRRDMPGKALDNAKLALESAQARHAASKAALVLASADAYWNAKGSKAEKAFWASQEEATKEAFDLAVGRVLDDLLLHVTEAQIMKRVDWIRNDSVLEDADGNPAPSFTAYNEERKHADFVKALIATPSGERKSEPRFADYLEKMEFVKKVRAGAAQRLARLEKDLSIVKSRVAIAEVLAKHPRLLFLGVELSGRGDQLGLACGLASNASLCIPADSEIESQVMKASSRLLEIDPEGTYKNTEKGLPTFTNLLRGRDTNALSFVTSWGGAAMFLDSLSLTAAGHMSFSLVTLGDSRKDMGTPFDTFDNLLPVPQKETEAAAAEAAPAAETAAEAEKSPLENLKTTARLLAAVVSQSARGQNRIVPVSPQPVCVDIRGRVVSQIGDSLTPNHKMHGAVVYLMPRIGMKIAPGINSLLVETADWDGEFVFPALWDDLVSNGWGSEKTVTSDAAIIDPDSGEVTWVLSMAKSGPPAGGLPTPYTAQGIKFKKLERMPLTVVLFRASGVQIFPMADPNTMRPYASMGYMTTEGFAAPKDFKLESSPVGTICFFAPDEELFFCWMKGKKSQPGLMEIRAFSLNAEDVAGKAGLAEMKDLEGKGYLVADTPTINNVELDVARSMARVNAVRAAKQKKYGMTDPMIESYSKKAVELSSAATTLAAEKKFTDAKHKAADSIAYSANIHQVIRQASSDSVWGILFYLLLAMPFAFFVEKLLIGHPDLRYQILYQGIIFLLFFLALRAVHPAYMMVRSSYMILLGFITLSLSVMVGAFISSKFSKNVSDLRKRFQKQVEVADVSRAGAAATAYVLGLNNLRKRPVRTGLTICTLILITFVMICFTSVQTNLVDNQYPVGKAPYTGLLIRDRNLQDVADAELALREIYGKDHVVATRGWGANLNPAAEQVEYAEYVIQHSFEEKTQEHIVHGIIGLSHLEKDILPVKGLMTVLRDESDENFWFKSDTEYSCFLPSEAASALQVTPEAVKDGSAVVTISGHEYAVLGIFDSTRLDSMLDLDGEPIMPVDVVAMQVPGSGARQEDAEDEMPNDVSRLESRSVILTPVKQMPASTLTASIAIKFNNVSYKQAREIINSHLEKTGETAFYGLDGIAFWGGKFRMGSLTGLIDLILPIIVAALTVLNTMRGSVYERQSELYVFNAVGLAPNHIRFLFIAEASVYAVVGAVGGYLLAQAVGTLVQQFDLMAGLTINYSSLSSVFVSLVIMAMVFISSIFPARMAAQLAAPSEIMTRERATAEGDILELELPFTFNKRDRIAIIPYFMDWFENFGEGSSGEFFCNPPVCGIRDEGERGLTPFVSTLTWLKPYDLGVSQETQLAVRYEPETQDYIAFVIITRKSGDLESWGRCNHAFIGQLRKQFLTWRGVDDENRQLLLKRAQELLDTTGENKA